MASARIVKDVSTLKLVNFQFTLPSEVSVTPGSLYFSSDLVYYVDSNGDSILLSGGSGAPTNATYVVISANGSLTAERILTAGTGISVVDGGANGPVTINNTDGGSAVTLSSAGGTQTLVNDGVGPALAVKGLTAGASITLTPTGNDITIDNTSPASSVTLTSAGGTQTLVNDGVGPALAVKGLTAGANITLTPTGNDITIAAAGGSGATWVNWPATVMLEGNIVNTTVFNARYLQTGTAPGDVVQFFANLQGDINAVGTVDIELSLPSVEQPDLPDSSPVGPVNINQNFSTGGFTRVFVDGTFQVGIQFESTSITPGALFSCSGYYVIA